MSDRTIEALADAIIARDTKAMMPLFARFLEEEGFAIVPVEPTDKMVLAATASTASWQRIEGSAMTVNQEKARIRYRAMVAAGRIG